MTATDPIIQDSFAATWQEELKDHFDEEERLLGPLAPPDHRSQLKGEHDTIRQAASKTEVNGLTLEECHALGHLLDHHIRWEERDLFPTIEASASEATLASLAVGTAILEKHRRNSTAAPRRHELADKRPRFESLGIDLAYLIETAAQTGPLWGTESEQLDTTLLFWRQGEGIANHINDEVDVLLIFLKGSAQVAVGDQTLIMAAGQAIMVPRNTQRSLLALEECSHLNVHQRRKRLSPLRTTTIVP